MQPLVEAAINKVIFPGQKQSVLEDINLAIDEGDFAVVTGPAASGKSVLCHCLTGAIPRHFPAYFEGKITIGGRDVHLLSLPEMAGLVGYMMEDPQNQLFSTTIGEDVAFGPGNLALPRGEVVQRVQSSLEFAGLKGYELRAPETLSGGESQRAVLAGVIALHPRLLVLDQPTAELDPAGRQEIYSRLKELARLKQVAIFCIADHPRELIGFATRFITMEGGRITGDTPHYLPKKTVSYFPTNPASKESSIMGELENCTYHYPNGQEGCKKINLKLYKGELTALLGKNGSGKTTVAKHLNGLLLPQQGAVSVAGQLLTKKTLGQIRKKVGYLFQNPDYQIFAGTVEAEAAFGLKTAPLTAEQIKDRVTEALTLTGLLSLKNQHPQRLSRGQRQLLALASLLAQQSEIIVADEPTTGLNEEMAAKVMEILSQLAARGKTVLLVTHDVELAVTYAHRLLVMKRHTIVLDIPAHQTPNFLPELQEANLLQGGEKSWHFSRATSPVAHG